MLQPLDIGDDLAVVADEVGIDGPFAGDQAVTDHQPSGFDRIDLFVGHAPGGVEHEAVEHAPLVCHGLAAVLFPVRVAPRTLDQVACSGFDPFRADGGGGARLQAAGVDQFGRHQPAGALGVLRGGGLSTLGLGLATVEDGRRMQHELLLVRALPARPFGQAVGDVTQQAGQQRAMDDVRCGFVGVDLPVEPAHQLGELTDDISPFTQLADGQEFASDAVGQRPVRFAALLAASLLLLPVAPQPDPGQEVGLRHVEAGVRLIGCLLGRGWAFARVLHGQGGRDDQDLGQTAGAMAGQQHARQARVDRQACQLAANGSEPLAIVDGAQFVEQGVAVGDGLGGRPVQEREGRDFGQAQRVHAQNDRGQRRAQDLGVSEGGAVLEVVFTEQADADTFGHPAAAAGTLVGGSTRDGLDEELVDLAADAVAQHARQARIDDVADTRDRQRGLGHVGGQHDARGVAGVEDALLVSGRQTGIEGHDLGAGQQQIGPAAAALPPACAATRHGTLQVLGRLADLALAGQEHQHVAGLLVPQLAHGGLDGRRQVGLVVLVFGLHVFRRPIADLDRIQAPGDLDDGCGPSGFTEVLGKAGGVDGGRGDDELEVIATRAIDELLEVAQQEVDVETALVRLVDDEGVVGREQAVTLAFGQQDAIGHQLDAGARRDLLVEAYLVADIGAQRRAHFFGNAGGDAAGSNAARLGMADEPAPAGAIVAHAPAGLQAELGQLGGLARPGLAGDDDHAVVADGFDDTRPVLGDGQGVDDGPDGSGDPGIGHGRGFGGIHGGIIEGAGPGRRRVPQRGYAGFRGFATLGTMGMMGPRPVFRWVTRCPSHPLLPPACLPPNGCPNSTGSSWTGCDR